MRLGADEFIRRFLLHVLPRGFTRLRHYGLLANRSRTGKLALCRAMLGQPDPEPLEPETTQEMMLRLTGIDITVCRQCRKGTLRQILILDRRLQTLMRATEDRTSVTMRQSRPRPDINAPITAPITAPRPPLRCSHPERRRNIVGCPCSGTEISSERTFAVASPQLWAINPTALI